MSIYTYNQMYAKELLKVYDQREVTKILDMAFEHVTNMVRTDRIVNQFSPLTPEQKIRLENIFEQLMLSRPVQYVLNEAWFGGIKLYINDNVLIPRPETDELVDWIVRDAASQLDNISTFKILDIGTGSGCIPLALKKKLFKIDLTAIDISEKALEVAKKNSDSYRANVELNHLDILDESKWKELDTYQVIVSNPPYIKNVEKANMHKNVLDYEPAIALFVPDSDPLLFYIKIAHFAQSHLTDSGAVYVEINEALGKETLEVFTNHGFTTQLKRDLQGKDRMIKAWRR